MKSTLALIAITASAVWCPAAFADESSSCKSQQAVSLSWDGSHLATWDVTDGEMKSFELPNGFNLGVKLATVDDNLVEISLHSMSDPDQPQLSKTFGGENSLQGFGARGGANRVEELGDPGILLELSNPGCAKGAGAALAGKA
ncbi:hypothetical protein [Xanthomonas sp. XNM01]|uniref:hypothetical protein n=1 Tax=Xanthomonas sp. XNM01 TaxID=2769289 RepID=UPI00177F2DEB|nr:hypothetical protein [Xanthomonas sp. XNM01]MBD9370851.1 hypothetical protein [Xanthomonas sp. XNM01]